MHVIGGALYKSKAFKNVAVEGVILGTDGRKMSKNLGNYPDPKELLGKYGGDALRLYLMSSPIMNGEDIIISEDQYRQQVKGLLLILWNTYNFFVSYANVDGWEKSENPEMSENILDKWILSKLNGLVKNVTKNLDNYNTVLAIENTGDFVNQFSTWYVRRSRDRVGSSSENINDRNAFYETSYEVFVTLSKLLAPVAPFMVEEMYKNLTGEESVHLAKWPEFDEKMIDENLEKEMSSAREISSIFHEQRKVNGIKVRIPLVELTYQGPIEFGKELLQVILDEANVENLKFESGKSWGVSGDFSENNQNKAKGQAREIIRSIQAERKVIGTTLSEKVNVSLESWPEEYESEIKRKALINNLTTGAFKVTKV